MWLRVAIEQVYWIFVAFAFSSYFVGLLYAMPVTTREGIFAVYHPEVVFGTKPLPPIHVLTPTTVQKNSMLAIGAIYPTIFGAGLGIASGALHDSGHYYASRVLMLLQYSNWVLILYTMALMFFYYGLKYTFILRANIIIAEAALKAPRAAFGIGNLKSRSPARFLFIQLQITGFGGCAVTVLAGTLCILWVLFKDRILEMPNDRLPHTMAVFWTCAIALAFFVVMSLIAAQSVRSRRRGLHEPSTTTATMTLSHSGGQKSSANRASKSGHQFNISDPETGLTHDSSHELDSQDSEKGSLERYDDPRYIVYLEESDRHRATVAASVAAMAALSDSMDQEAAMNGQNRDSWRPVSPTSPTRSLTIQINNGQAMTKTPSNIRESVFGGRTIREDGTPGSPPLSGGGFSLPSFPLVAMRSNSKNSIPQQPRPSTSSATHTSSTISSRLSHGSSKHGTSSSGSLGYPLPPTSPALNPASLLQQQTQQQLQQLPQSNPRVSLQRIHVKGGSFQTIPESTATATAGEDYGGDLLYSDSMRQASFELSSPPPQSPKHARMKSSSRTQPSPIMVPTPSSPRHQAQYIYHESNMPFPPTSSVKHYQQPDLPTDMQLQQQHPLHQVAFKGLSPPPRSTPQSPTSPTSPVRRTGGAMVSPPTSPTIITAVPLNAQTSPSMQTQSQQQQASPRMGNGVRRGASNGASKENREREVLTAPSPSVAAVVAASRGPGGGYQSQKDEPTPLQSHPQSLRGRGAPVQKQELEEEEDGASVGSAEDNTWPLPPTFKS
ncbi:hypothetical protein BGZ54_007779 [Gamsiella multidivaricata]|nr:hypothetical protein BGZ54_007779 [Gamsiella multidivaricata]